MPAPDLFGIKDYVRLLSAPPGMEAVHADGMSWAKNGLTYPESTKLTDQDWNIIIGNLRGLLLGSGLDINTMDPASPLLLRDVVLALIIAKTTELLPGVVLANAAAVAEHVTVPAGSTAILNTHEAAGHLSAYFRAVLTAPDGEAARAALGVDAAIAALVNSSPAALDTLAELATALGNDPNFATTITNALAGKSAIGHTHAFSGLTGLGSFLLGAGAYMSGATGGDPGPGKINVVEVQQNGVPIPFSKSFASAPQTITSGGALTLAHGLGAKPKLIGLSLICQIAEGNYSIGDEVFATWQSDNVNGRGVAIVPDATNLNCRFGNSTTLFITVNKNTGALFNAGNANWQLVVRAWL